MFDHTFEILRSGFFMIYTGIWVLLYAFLIFAFRLSFKKKKHNMESKLESAREISEKYKVLLDTSHSVIFEIDPTTKQATFSKKQFGILGRELSSDFFINASDNVNSGDELKLSQKYEECVSEKTTLFTEISILNGNMDYSWIEVQFSPIISETGEIISIIGRLTDIDDKMKEKAVLLYKSQIDSLTGLYNKQTIESLVNNFIKTDLGGCGISALFSIDIDDFKLINDTRGHLYGDRVLKNLGITLIKFFRKTDICGRFGGDEFVVFLKNAPDEEFVRKKADELIEEIYDEYNKPGKAVMSISIGISFCNRHGKNFHILFKNADIALYHAKNTGKNKSYLYDESLTNVNSEFQL